MKERQEIIAGLRAQADLCHRMADSYDAPCKHQEELYQRGYLFKRAADVIEKIPENSEA